MGILVAVVVINIAAQKVPAVAVTWLVANQNASVGRYLGIQVPRYLDLPGATAMWAPGL